MGGRRWAKFAKYLTSLNYSVYVVAVDFPYEGACPWEKDTVSYRENIYRIPNVEQRPFYQVEKSPRSVFGKIRYRFSWYKDKLIPTIFNEDPIDISSKNENHLKVLAHTLIREKKIDTVIVTGGPYKWCYELMNLKRTYPELKFLLDLRDFWTGGVYYQGLKPEFQQRENFRETSCMELADTVFTPAERIVDHLRSRYTEFEHKVVHLPHAFDQEELPILESGPMNRDILSFAYAGILYPEMEDTIDQVIQLLRGMKNRGIAIRLDLYAFNSAYESRFIEAGLSKEVVYHQPIPPKQLFERLSQTDYLLQLRAGLALEQHFKSTKFYELIALRRPVIYFGPKGDIEEFLLEHHLGFSRNTDPDGLITAIINNKVTMAIPEKHFDVSEYEFVKVTDQLETYL